MPVVQQEITGGQAQITGQFSHDEAKKIVYDYKEIFLPFHAHIIYSSFF